MVTVELVGTASDRLFGTQADVLPPDGAAVAGLRLHSGRAVFTATQPDVELTLQIRSSCR